MLDNHQANPILDSCQKIKRKEKGVIGNYGEGSVFMRLMIKCVKIPGREGGGKGKGGGVL